MDNPTLMMQSKVNKTRKDEMTVKFINYGHPLTATAAAELEEAVRDEVTTVTVKFLLDLESDLIPQIEALVNQVGLTPDEWQTEKIVIGLCGMATAAALLTAHIAGRMGYMPTIIWLKMQTGVTPPVFEFAGLLGLDAIRQSARKLR